MTNFFHYFDLSTSSILSRGLDGKSSGKIIINKVVGRSANFPRILPHILSPAFRADLRRFRFKSRDFRWLLLDAEMLGPRLEKSIHWLAIRPLKYCKSCRIAISYYPNNYSVVILDNAERETYRVNPYGFTSFCPVCIRIYSQYIAERPVHSMGITEHLDLCEVMKVMVE